jgi:hypothetical protein
MSSTDTREAGNMWLQTNMAANISEHKASALDLKMKAVLQRLEIG